MSLAPAPYRYLSDQERLVLVVRRHGIVLVRPALVALALVAGAAVAGFVTGTEATDDFVDTVAGLVAMVGLARFAWKLGLWWVDRVVVTDRRFIEISGLFTRNVATMPLSHVTDMTYKRTLMGRLLGYGELRVESAGQDQALNRLDHLPRPDDFYRTVTALATADLSLKPDPDPQPAGPPPFTGWGKPDEEDTGPLPRVIV